MMSDGGDNLSDITGEASGNEIRVVEQVPTVHSAEAASGTTGENTEAAADSEVKKESVPVKEKLLHAASAAGTAASAAANKSVEVATKVTVEVSSAASAAAVKSAEIAVKVTGEVVEAVGKVSHKVVETAGTAVRRFTQTGASAEPGAEEGQPAQNSEPENDSKESAVSAPESTASAEAVSASTESGEGPASSEAQQTEEKPSMWNKVRRFSGAAILQAQSAAGAAYKAAEPIAHKAGHTVADVSAKVADGAKSAYEASKPIAQATATRVAEGATTVWGKTKDGTVHVMDRVRSLSTAGKHPEVSSDGATAPEPSSVPAEAAHTPVDAGDVVEDTK